MVLDAAPEGRGMSDDEDQAVSTDVAERGAVALAAATDEARRAGEPLLMYEGTFKLYADPTGAIVLVVEKPGEKPAVKVFSRRMVRMMSRMVPAMFGGRE